MTEQELRDTLHARSQRVTPQRVLIHRALGELQLHVTAEQVLDRVSADLPNASLPTVYATLELLRELGVVRKLAPGDGPALWDPGTEPHQHIACRECGAVEDLAVELDTAALASAALRASGFRTDSAELVLSGLCARCAR